MTRNRVRTLLALSLVMSWAAGESAQGGGGVRDGLTPGEFESNVFSAEDISNPVVAAPLPPEDRVNSSAAIADSLTAVQAAGLDSATVQFDQLPLNGRHPGGGYAHLQWGESTELETPAGNVYIQGTIVYSENFEDFSLGPISGQSGWTGSGIIEETSFTGFGERTAVREFFGPAPNTLGMRSPLFPDVIGSLSLDVVIEGAGARHAITPIDFSFPLVNTRLVFEPNGEIVALQLDPESGSGVFEPTTGSWKSGEVNRFTFEIGHQGSLTIRQNGPVIFEGTDVVSDSLGYTIGMNRLNIEHFDVTGSTSVYIDNIEAVRLIDARLYVDHQSPAPPGERDGLSWDTAFVSLEDALSAAALPGVQTRQIWIAAGRYVPENLLDGGDPRSATFLVPPGVQLIGGFAGGETNYSQRDPASNPVILNGDLLSDDGPNFENREDNAYSVVTILGDPKVEHPEALLDSLAIRGGNANGAAPWNTGGGVRMEHADAQMRDVRIVDCSAASGGGMSLMSDSAARFLSGEISGCRATGDGGGVLAVDSWMRLSRSVVAHNRAVTGSGGGVHFSGAAPDGTRLIDRTLFHNNRAAGPGGGAAAGDTRIVNCTFAANRASRGAGVHILGGDLAQLHNSIVYHNRATNVSGRSAQVSFGTPLMGGNNAIDIRFNCIQNLDSFTDAPTTPILGNNIAANPILTDHLGEDFQLFPGSPCIDAGSNSLQVSDDISPVSDQSTPNTGEGSPPIVDMGHHEFDPSADGAPRIWTRPEGGSLQNPGGGLPIPGVGWWPANPAPDAEGHGVFQIDGAYSVGPETADFTTGRLTFVRGDVTIDTSDVSSIVGLFAPQESLAVGYWAGESATVRIEGESVIVEEAVIGRDPGSFGELIVSPDALLQAEMTRIVSGRHHLEDPTTLLMGQVVVERNGTLSGSGEIFFDSPNGVVENKGIVAPGDGSGTGSLTLSNLDYVQKSSGSLSIDIASPTENSSLVLDGLDAELSGSLLLNFVGGYVPTVGATFELITLPNVNSLVQGVFSAIHVSGLPAGLGVEIEYPVLRGMQAQAVTVTVIQVASPAVDFEEFESFDVPGMPAAGALIDVNGDGRLDLIVVVPDQDDPENSPGVAAVLLNQGTTNGDWDGFELEAIFPVGANPVAIAVADFDNADGPDIAVANRGDDSLSVLLNQGVDGMGAWLGFSGAIDIPVLNAPRDVAAADFDGDGLVDLAVSGLDDNGEGALMILTNLGLSRSARGTSFSPTQTLVVGIGSGTINPMDTDGDKDPDIPTDILAAEEGSNEVVQFANVDLTGMFAEEARLEVGSEPSDIVDGDLSGNGFPDVVVSNFNDGTLSVLENNGDGTFASAITLPVGPEPVSVALADVDGEGALPGHHPNLDILAIANNDEGRPVLKLLRNIRGQEIGLFFAPVEELDAETWPVQVLVGDLTGNDKSDIVTINADPDPPPKKKALEDVTVFLNLGGFTLGDLNGDGSVGSADLAILLGSWGVCPPEPKPCPADISGDGSVGSADLATLLGNWGNSSESR
ncbi:MAG: hypothetical protein EA376_01755 [Phycisphaeraceae bacterium]|nr:MAG: hypothetical protein EA376_01755 [Phycisphaeraceae bacterium]